MGSVTSIQEYSKGSREQARQLRSIARVAESERDSYGEHEKRRDPDRFICKGLGTKRQTERRGEKVEVELRGLLSM